MVFGFDLRELQPQVRGDAVRWQTRPAEQALLSSKELIHGVVKSAICRNIIFGTFLIIKELGRNLKITFAQKETSEHC